MCLHKDDISRYKGEIMGTDYWETPDGVKEAWQDKVKEAYDKGFRDGWNTADGGRQVWLEEVKKAYNKGLRDGRNATIECIKTALKKDIKKQKV